MVLINITEFFKDLADHETISGILIKLSKQLIIDTVPVIRCCDCRYGKCGTDNIVKCSHPCGKVIFMKSNDFCSYGQKKEAEHEA